MKHLLLTTIAAVVLVGCGKSKGEHLFYAALEGRTKDVELYLDNGANAGAEIRFQKRFPWSKGIGGATPLHVAKTKEFADKFNLNYERDYNKIQALITGLQGEINGVYNPENDLLNFSDEDYVPIFSVPKLIMEQSKDLRKWTKVQLADPIPENYLWPEDIKIEIKKDNKENTFYRVAIKEE